MTNRTQTLALGLVLGAATALPALAGGYAAPVVEPPLAAPMPVEVTRHDGDWTGGFVAGQLSYGDSKFAGTSDQGMLYGLRAGYDYDLGNWVVGAAIDWNKADINMGVNSLDSITRLGLRAGYDMGRTLVYATAGGAHAKIDTPTGGLSDNGWFGGIGVDYAINDRWTLGGEVLSHHFGNFDGTGSSLNTTTAGLNLGLRF